MSIEVISCEVGRPSQSILQMGQTSSSGGQETVAEHSAVGQTSSSGNDK